MTETELNLLLDKHQVSHHSPDLPAEGDRDGLAHRGVVDGAELLARKPLSGNSEIDKQASNEANKQITVGGAG
jgi:hypothetical protein